MLTQRPAVILSVISNEVLLMLPLSRRISICSRGKHMQVAGTRLNCTTSLYREANLLNIVFLLHSEAYDNNGAVTITAEHNNKRTAFPSMIRVYYE